MSLCQCVQGRRSLARPALRASCPAAQGGTWERRGFLSHPTQASNRSCLHGFLRGPSSPNLPFRSVTAWSPLVTRCCRLLRQHLGLSFPVMVPLPQLNSEPRERCWAGATVPWVPSPSSCPPTSMGTPVGLAGEPASPPPPPETPGQDCASPLQGPQDWLSSPNFSPPLGAHTSVLSHLRLGQPEPGQVDMGGNGDGVSPHFPCESLSPKVRGCAGWRSLALLQVGPGQGAEETTKGQLKTLLSWVLALENPVCL